MKKSNKFKTLMIVALVVIFGGVFAWDGIRAYFMKQYFANFQPPPATISAVKAKAETWHPNLDAVGTFVAIKGVDITSEVSGIVEAINFKSGQMVNKGDLLVTLNDNPEVADLANFESQLKLAKMKFNRAQKLLAKGAFSSQQYDEAQAGLQEAQANVDKTKAIIAQKNITAPFAGKLGIRLINLGQFITPGQTKMVTLQSLDPLYIHFYLPEQDLRLVHVNQKITYTVESYAGEAFTGKVVAIDSKVDPQTHNVLIQAIVSNKALHFFPGMYANVKVILPSQQNVITVPKTAISYSLYGDSVFVVKETKTKDKKGKPELKAYRQFIKSGETRGNQVAITSGLKAGDLVVDSGQLKLQNGMRVIVNNAVKLY